MTTIRFEPKSCEKTRECLDSYVSNELLVETCSAVQKHLETCEDCAEALAVRLCVKSRLQRAVKRETGSLDLKVKIQKQIRQADRRALLTLVSSRWALAAAALLVLSLGGLGTLGLWSLRQVPNVTSKEAVVDAPNEPATAILGIGLSDHVLCALNLRFPENAPTFEQMSEALGSDYVGLVPLVKEKVPDARVLAVHQCTVNGRAFVHIILERNETIVSVSLTRKRGLSFSDANPADDRDRWRASIYRAHLQDFEVAGFETKEHLAFVASSLVTKDNSQIAANLAPAFRDLLTRLEN